jgi:iron(III) transport system substrate-binding protein
MTMFRTMASGVLAVAATLGATVAHAQAYQPAEWAKIVEAARKEGKVTWYSGAPVELSNALRAGFRKAYPGIEVELERGPSGGMMAKIDRERAAGVDGADVFLTSEVSYMRARNKDGKLHPLTGPSSVGYPARFIYDDVLANVGVEPVVMFYNTKLISVAPTGLADVLKPEYRNRLASTELAGTFVMAWHDWVEKSLGADFFVKMRSQNPKLYNGGAPVAQAVAAGEAAIGAFAIPANVSPLIAAGAPIKFIVPNPALALEFVVGAFGWSKRPNAARVFTDYVMSREAQIIWHGTGNSASPLPGIPGSLSIANMTTWDPSAWPPERAAQYRLYWDKIFK